MSTEHPAAIMRRAASRLREATAGATPPPWRVSFIDGIEPVIDGPGLPDGHMIAEVYRCEDPGHQGRPEADAALAVLLRNSAESLAGWLEDYTRRAESAIILLKTVVAEPRRFWCRWCERELQPNVDGCKCWDAALAVSRAILGEGRAAEETARQPAERDAAGGDA